jgi:hypothetical protein
MNEAFEGLHLDAPLRKLDDSDRIVLWALLLTYAHFSPEKLVTEEINDLERLSKIMADAARVGAELRSEVLEGPLSGPFRPFIAGFADVPLRLARFSERLGKELNSYGKPGHKARIRSTQWLVEASEFIRLKTHQYNDEHLADLFQAIETDYEEPQEDLSSDAIRKKRKYLKKHYPRRYADALEQAKKLALPQAMAAAAAQPIPDTLNAASSRAVSEPGTSTSIPETPAGLLRRT